MDTLQSPPSVHYRKWLVLFGSILLQTSIGSMFLFGNSTPYLASYMSHARSLLIKQTTSTTSITQSKHNELYELYLCECNWIFVTCYTVFILSSLLGGHIQQQIGVTPTLILSSLFMCIGTLLCTFTCVNLYALIFCYLLFGCGAGIAYPVSFVSCLEWFKNTKSGNKSNNNNNQYSIIVLLNICFASGALIFAPIQLSIINPNNVAIDSQIGFIGYHDIMERIPSFYIYLTVIIAIMQIIAILLISNPSLNKPLVYDSHISEHHDHDIVDNMNVAVPPHSCQLNQPTKYIAYHSIYDVKYKGDKAKYQMRPIEVLLNGKFWQLWMMHFFSMIIYFFMILFWKIFAIQYLNINDDRYLTTIISIAFAINGICRYLWNKLYQSCRKMTNKKLVLFVINLVLCLFTASLSVSNGLGINIKTTIYTIWLFVIFSVIGCEWMIYPSLIATTFGQRYSGSIIGYMCIADIPAILIVVTLCGHLYTMDTGSWQGFTLIIAACLVFGVILIIVLDPAKVIAERQLKDTMRNLQFPTYDSIASATSLRQSQNNVMDSDVDHGKKSGCGCDTN